jgi:hypothetical protein
MSTIMSIRVLPLTAVAFLLACGGESVVGDAVHTISGDTAPDGACAISVDGAPPIVRVGRAGATAETASVTTAYCGGDFQMMFKGSGSMPVVPPGVYAIAPELMEHATTPRPNGAPRVTDSSIVVQTHCRACIPMGHDELLNAGGGVLEVLSTIDPRKGTMPHVRIHATGVITSGHEL